MTKKMNENLNQNPQISNQSNPEILKGSLVEYLNSKGIKSKNTTQEKVGQTTLVFINRSKPPVEDDSLEASIRYLKFKRMNK
jgi:hypothetical protein